MKICMIQICSGLNPADNLKKINDLILKAKSQEPELKAVFLPEVFYSMSDGENPTTYLVEGENDHFENIRLLAKEHQVYILGGSAASLVGGKVMNRSFNFDPRGELIDIYDKVHLFTLDLKAGDKKTQLDERNLYDEGSELKLIDVEDFKLGLSICFDLRFPEMFREYFKQGANILSISSAFTVPTGKAHWKTLVRARAIENQSYVVACNQWGRHNDQMNSYGHSLIIDPWGEVLAELGAEENFAIAEISIERIKEIRSRMDMTSRI